MYQHLLLLYTFLKLGKIIEVSQYLLCFLHSFFFLFITLSIFVFLSCKIVTCQNYLLLSLSLFKKKKKICQNILKCKLLQQIQRKKFLKSLSRGAIELGYNTEQSNLNVKNTPKQNVSIFMFKSAHCIFETLGSADLKVVSHLGRSETKGKGCLAPNIAWKQTNHWPMEVFVLLWVIGGGCHCAVGKGRQLWMLAKQGGGVVLHYHHLPEKDQQTKLKKSFFA